MNILLQFFYNPPIRRVCQCGPWVSGRRPTKRRSSVSSKMKWKTDDFLRLSSSRSWASRRCGRKRRRLRSSANSFNSRFFEIQFRSVATFCCHKWVSKCGKKCCWWSYKQLNLYWKPKSWRGFDSAATRRPRWFWTASVSSWTRCHRRRQAARRHWVTTSSTTDVTRSSGRRRDVPSTFCPTTTWDSCRQVSSSPKIKSILFYAN